MENNEQIVRQYFRAYETGDRQMIEQLLSDDFHFSSPYDDRIDKAHYMERCWPTHTGFRRYNFKSIMTHGDDVLLRYECETENFGILNNAEYFKVKHELIEEVVVYFGDGSP